MSGLLARGARSRRATAPPGRDERWEVWGAMSGPLARGARSRRATAPPGRDERWGFGGPCRGPPISRRLEFDAFDAAGDRDDGWRRERTADDVRDGHDTRGRDDPRRRSGDDGPGGDDDAPRSVRPARAQDAAHDLVAITLERDA